jgi:hypothetical protein
VAGVSAPDLIVRIDPQLGISRPFDDRNPRCSKCASEIDPDHDHLVVLDVWPTGARSLWVYCEKCGADVRQLFGLESGDHSEE